MWKKIVGVLRAVGAGFVAYDYFSAGLHTRPEMPKGAFSLSYKNGMRAILVGIPNEEGISKVFRLWDESSILPRRRLVLLRSSD